MKAIVLAESSFIFSPGSLCYAVVYMVHWEELFSVHGVFQAGGPWSQVMSSWRVSCICGRHLHRWLPQLLFLKWWRLAFSCVLIVPGTCLLLCLPGFSLAVVLPGLWLVDILPLAMPDWLPIFLFLSAGNHVLFSFRLSSFLLKLFSCLWISIDSPCSLA